MVRAATGRTNDSANVPITPADDGVGLLARHVWEPALATGEYRLVARPRPEPGWRTLEEYYVLPSATQAEILVPALPRQPLGHLLGAYSGLRALRPRLARYVLSGYARTGLPISRSRVALQHAVGAPPNEVEPLTVIRNRLGREFVTALGIRRGANAKASIHLYDHSGVPAGLAKLSWNTLTREYVTNEARVLQELEGRAGPVRTPRLVLTSSLAGNAYLVAAPLPLSVRQFSDHRGITPAEIGAAFPILRSDVVGNSDQLRRLTARLETYRVGCPADLAPLYRDLSRALLSNKTPLQITHRWHGDLVPWNTARDADGELWLWDWESSEPDAVAGLDLIHWHLNSRRTRPSLADALDAALPELIPSLQALGYGPGERALTAAVYALVIAERAAGLAEANGGWDRVRINQTQCAALLNLGLRLANRTKSSA